MKTKKFHTTTFITAAVIVASLCFGMPSMLAQTTGGATDGVGDSLRIDDGTTTFQREAWRAGVYLGLNINDYTADNLRGMPGVPSCCPGFNEGGGVGIAAGATVEKPLTDWFSIGGRLYLSTYNGALVDQETMVVDEDGHAANAVIEHRIDADIMATAFEPIVLFGVADNLKLFTGVRGDVIVQKLFAQKEEILEPSDIVYETGRRTRLEYDGAVPNGTSFQGAIVAGVRYDFFVDKKKEWAVAPELSAWYGLTPVIRDESWKIHGIRLAVVGQYLRYEQEELPIEEAPAPIYDGSFYEEGGSSDPTGAGLSEVPVDFDASLPDVKE